MKKLLLTITLAVGISGCSVMPQYYDNNEYELLARLETSVRLIQEDCAKPEEVVEQLPTLIHDAELLHTYTYYIPKNTEVFDMATILKDDVREFEAQYEKGAGNTLYCKLKTKAFLEKVRLSLDAVAKKQRK